MIRAARFPLLAAALVVLLAGTALAAQPYWQDEGYRGVPADRADEPVMVARAYRPASEAELARRAEVRELLLLAQADEELFSEDELASEWTPEEGEAPATTREDPWEGFNRAMFEFNDFFYMYLLEPTSTVYAVVIPELFRHGISNAYDNVRYPIRLVNNLLQGKLENAGRETLKFLSNTVFGFLGLVEVTRDKAFLNPPEQDLGKTFRVWGAETGPYVVWPVLGPSTIRNTVGDVGDGFLDPVNYVRPYYWPYVLHAHDRVNQTSLRLGDYGKFKESSLDPYVALRSLYFQSREAKEIDPWRDDGNATAKQAEEVPGF
ncbi:MlaA family lipoprotein [Desulfohalovibrio reitneri]|uniref:MlaA family lipoprotein n=1 Tax=Desulfohalovibrio reitneri TaxID=1307759 RepID=UPI00068ABA5C|nr:VacJ family lipoprotein [Desulfohalovibrio reitneri]